MNGWLKISCRSMTRLFVCLLILTHLLVRQVMSINSMCCVDFERLDRDIGKEWHCGHCITMISDVLAVLYSMDRV